MHVCVCNQNTASLFKKLPRKTKPMSTNREKILQGYIFLLFFEILDQWFLVKPCTSVSFLKIQAMKISVRDLCVCVLILATVCSLTVYWQCLSHAKLKALIPLSILTTKNRWNWLSRLFLTLHQPALSVSLMCALAESLKLIWYQISQLRAIRWELILDLDLRLRAWSLLVKTS